MSPLTFCICYDFDDTIFNAMIDQNRLPAIAYQIFCKQIGVSDKTADTCRDLFKANSDILAFRAIMNSKAQHSNDKIQAATNDFRNCILKTIKKIYGTFENDIFIDEDKIIPYLLDLRESITLKVVAEYAKKLHLTNLGDSIMDGERTVYIITNGYASVVEHILTILGYTNFKVIGTKEFYENKLDGKPDPGVLELASHTFGVPKERIKFYVGDSEKVDGGFAKECNIAFAYYDGKGGYVNRQRELGKGYLIEALRLFPIFVRERKELSRETRGSRYFRA